MNSYYWSDHVSRHSISDIHKNSTRIKNSFLSLFFHQTVNKIRKSLTPEQKWNQIWNWNTQRKCDEVDQAGWKMSDRPKKGVSSEQTRKIEPLWSRERCKTCLSMHAGMLTLTRGTRWNNLLFLFSPPYPSRRHGESECIKWSGESRIKRGSSSIDKLNQNWFFVLLLLPHWPVAVEIYTRNSFNNLIKRYSYEWDVAHEFHGRSFDSIKWKLNGMMNWLWQLLRIQLFNLFNPSSVGTEGFKIKSIQSTILRQWFAQCQMLLLLREKKYQPTSGNWKQLSHLLAEKRECWFENVSRIQFNFSFELSHDDSPHRRLKWNHSINSVENGKKEKENRSESFGSFNPWRA